MNWIPSPQKRGPSCFQNGCSHLNSQTLMPIVMMILLTGLTQLPMAAMGQKTGDVDSSSSSSPNSVSENTLVLPALGRGARLGGLYDSRTGQFLGLNIFRQDPFKEDTGLMSVTEIPETNMIFHVSNSLQDKFDTLGVEARIAVDIKSGTIKVDGSAKFLNEEKKSVHHVEGFLYYKSRTIKQYLNIFYDKMNEYISDDSLNRLNATHIVVAVEYGGDLYAQFTDRNENSEDVLDIEGALHLSFQTAAFSVDAEAKVKLNNEEKIKKSNYSVQIYGDVTGTSVPQDFQQVLDLIQKVPELLNGTNDGKGKPMVYTLMPLEVLREKRNLKIASQQLEEEIESSTYTEFIQIFEKISHTQQELNDLKELMKQNFVCVPDADYAELELLKNSYEKTATDFKGKVQEALKAVRLGLRDPASLSQTQTDYFNNQYNAKSVSAQLPHDFANVRKKIKFYTSLKKIGVTYLGRYDNLEAALLNQKNKKGDATMVQVLLYSPSLVKEDPRVWKENLHLFTSQAHLNRPFASLFVVDCDFDFPECQQVQQTVIRQYFEQNCLSTNAQVDLERQRNSGIASVGGIGVGGKGGEGGGGGGKIQRIDMPALGRVYQVGQLFDASTGNFFDSKTLLLKRGHPASAIQTVVISNPATTTSSSNSNVGSSSSSHFSLHWFSPFSLTKFFKTLNIPEPLGVSLLTQKLRVEGQWESANVFTTLPVNVHRLTGTCVSVERRMVEKLVLTDQNLLDTIAINLLNHNGRVHNETATATHFVSEIIYGTTTILSLEQKLSPDNPKIESDPENVRPNPRLSKRMGPIPIPADEMEILEENFNGLLKQVQDIFLTSPTVLNGGGTSAAKVFGKVVQSLTSSLPTTPATPTTSPPPLAAGSLSHYRVQAFSDVNPRFINSNVSLENPGQVLTHLSDTLSTLVSFHLEGKRGESKEKEEEKVKEKATGIPIMYVLQPIDSLHNFSLVIPPRSNASLFPNNPEIWTGFSSRYDELRDSQEILRKFKTRCIHCPYYSALTKEDKESLAIFSKNFANTTDQWRESVAKIFAKFQLGQAKQSDVEELNESFETLKLSPTLLKLSIEDKLAHIVEKLALVKLMKSHGIEYVGKKGSPKTILEDSKKEKKIIYFLITSRDRRAQNAAAWDRQATFFLKDLKRSFNKRFLVDCDFDFVCSQLEGTVDDDGTVIRQYFAGDLLSRDLLSELDTQGKGENVQLEIPALGTEVKVGQLYDVTSRLFLTKLIVAEEDGKESVHYPKTVPWTNDPDSGGGQTGRSIQVKELAAPCVGQETYENRFERLQIPPIVGLSLLSNNSRPAGPWKYCEALNFTAGHRFQHTDMCVQRQELGVQVLGLDDQNFFDRISLPKLRNGLKPFENDVVATHFVKKIIFGTTSLLFRTQDVQDTDEGFTNQATEQTVQASNSESLEALFAKLTGQGGAAVDGASSSKISATNSAAGGKDGKVNISSSSIATKYFSDMDPVGNVNTYPILEKDHFGQPLVYILEPLETLRNFVVLVPARPAKTTFPNSTIISLTYALFDELHESEVKVNEFMHVRLTGPSQKCLTDEDNEDLRKFEKQFHKNVTIWRTLAQETFWKYQNPNMDPGTSFLELRQQFSDSHLGLQDVDMALTYLFPHVAEKLRILSIMTRDDVIVIGRDGESKLNNILRSHHHSSVGNGNGDDSQEDDKAIYFLMSHRDWREKNYKWWVIQAKFFLTNLNKPYNKLIFLDCDHPSLKPCSNPAAAHTAMVMNDTQIDQYQRGQLTFSGVFELISNTTSDESNRGRDGRIAMRAAGRRADIGDLYDATKGRFVSKSIFKHSPFSAPQEFKDLLSISQDGGGGPVDGKPIEIEGHPLETYDKVFEALKLEPQVQLGILLEQFRLEGSGRFFDFLKTPKNFMSTAHTWIYETVTKRTSMTNAFDTPGQDLFSKVSGLGLSSNVLNGATHVVTEVEYGVTNIVTCRSSSNNCTNSERLKSILGEADGHLFGVGGGGGGGVDVDQQFWREHDVDIYYFSNTQFQSRPACSSTNHLIDASFCPLIPTEPVKTTTNNEVVPNDRTSRGQLPKPAPTTTTASSKPDKNSGTAPISFVLIPLQKLQRRLGFVANNLNYNHISALGIPQVLSRGLELYRKIESTRLLLSSLRDTMYMKIGQIAKSDLDRIDSIHHDFTTAATSFQTPFAAIVSEIMSGRQSLTSLAHGDQMNRIQQLIQTYDTTIKSPQFGPNRLDPDTTTTGSSSNRGTIVNPFGVYELKKMFETPLKKIKMINRMKRIVGEGLQFFPGRDGKNLSDIFDIKGTNNLYLLYYRQEWTEETNDKSKFEAWTRNSDFFFKSLEAAERTRIVVDCDFNVTGCKGLDRAVVHEYQNGMLVAHDAQANRAKQEKMTSQKIDFLQMSLDDLKVAMESNTSNLQMSIDQLNTTITEQDKQTTLFVNKKFDTEANNRKSSIEHYLNQYKEQVAKDVEKINTDARNLKSTVDGHDTQIQTALFNAQEASTTSKNLSTDFQTLTTRVNKEATYNVQKFVSVDLAIIGNVSTTEKSLKSQLSGSEQKIQKLEKVQAIRESYVWKITNFKKLWEQHKLGRNVTAVSTIVSIQRYRFQLLLYTNGFGTAEKSHMSIFYERMEGDYDSILDPLNLIPITWTLYAQNPSSSSTQSAVSNHDVSDGDYATGTGCESNGNLDGFSKPCGVLKFISHTKLNDTYQDFVVNDTIYIGVQLGANIKPPSALLSKAR